MYDPAFQAKVLPVLAAAFDDAFSDVTDGRVYFLIATPLHQYPAIIYQSQDAGGRNNDNIGENGWRGLITFRCLDITLSGAFNTCIQLADRFPTVTHSGYSISMKASSPQVLPTERTTKHTIYTSALIADVIVHKD